MLAADVKLVHAFLDGRDALGDEELRQRVPVLGILGEVGVDDDFDAGRPILRLRGVLGRGGERGEQGEEAKSSGWHLVASLGRSGQTEQPCAGASRIAGRTHDFTTHFPRCSSNSCRRSSCMRGRPPHSRGTRRSRVTPKMCSSRNARYVGLGPSPPPASAAGGPRRRSTRPACCPGSCRTAPRRPRRRRRTGSRVRCGSRRISSCGTSRSQVMMSRFAARARSRSATEVPRMRQLP